MTTLKVTGPKTRGRSGGVISEDLVDGHIACHPLRLIADAERYGALSKTLVAPAQLLPPAIATALAESGCLMDLGLQATEEEVFAKSGLIGIPAPQVLAYSLLACLSGGAELLYLAGFDGYSENDPRRNLEQKILDLILRSGHPGRVQAITPTRYNISQLSVYGMLR